MQQKIVLGIPKLIFDNMNTFYFNSDSRKYKSWENEHKTRKKCWWFKEWKNWKV